MLKAPCILQKGLDVGARWVNSATYTQNKFSGFFKELFSNRNLKVLAYGCKPSLSHARALPPVRAGGAPWKTTGRVPPKPPSKLEWQRLSVSALPPLLLQLGFSAWVVFSILSPYILHAICYTFARQPKVLHHCITMLDI